MGTQDSWPDGAATGLLLGVNGALFIMYGAMLSHYQLPFICKYLVPDFITNSPLNCWRVKPTPESIEKERKKAEKAKEREEASNAFREKYGNIEVVHAPQPPPPPLPDPCLDMDEEELDGELEKYFNRYDLDESGTLNGNDELQQLCTNLCFRLQLPLAGDEIDAIVDSAGELSDDNEWDVDEFCEWFEERFLGGDAEEPSLASEMMSLISLYQNAEIQEDILDDYEDDNDDDGDDGDDGGD